MKQDKCSFCSIPCEEDHCAWTVKLASPEPKEEEKPSEKCPQE